MISTNTMKLTDEAAERNTRELSDAELEAVTGGRLIMGWFSFGTTSYVIAADENSHNVWQIDS